MNEYNAYEVYSKAAVRVEGGWTQGTLDNGVQVCLMGGIMKGLPQADYGHYYWDEDFNLFPKALVNEISHKLRFKPLYLFMRVLPGAFWWNRKVSAIYMWNDAPWRRKASVVKVLRSLARDHQPRINLLDPQKELLRLQEQVQALMAQKAVMVARIARLEAENAHLWRRLLSQRDISSDREVLEALDAELEAAYTRIETLG